MGSKGRIPAQQVRRPLPGPGIGLSDPFAPGLRPPHGSFPPFDMLPPPEVMEQKLSAQHVDMRKLANENHRLAATHGTLRRELAAAQHELQMLRAHMGAMESDREQQTRSLMERIARMEADIQAAEPLKLELRKAQADAQELLAARQELVSKVQDLTQDLQKAHAELQQFPSLMSELENLRQEYQRCRATYDYEKKLYNDHLESLQVMEKNYMAMASEVEKLHAELTNSANAERRTGLPFGGSTGYSENDAAVHYPVGHNISDDGYVPHQGYGSLSRVSGGATGSAPTSASGASAPVAPAGAGGGATPNASEKSGAAPVRPSYDSQRGSNYDSQKGSGGPGYDSQRVMGGPGPGYDPQRGFAGPGYDPQRGPIGHGYDVQRGHSGSGYDFQRGAVSGSDMQRGPGPLGPVYDAQRAAGYDMQRGVAYDAQRGTSYDAQRGSSYNAQREPGYDSQRGSGYDAQRVPPEYDQGRGYTRSARK